MLRVIKIKILIPVMLMFSGCAISFEDSDFGCCELATYYMDISGFTVTSETRKYINLCMKEMQLPLGSRLPKSCNIDSDLTD